MPARNARRVQIERTLAEDAARSRRRQATGWRYYGGRAAKKNPQPMFCWSTTKVTVGNDTGWTSWVKVPVGPPESRVWEDVEESTVLHRTRKGAKARAANLYTGWRLARGLTPYWYPTA